MPNRINPRHVSRVILYEKKKKEKISKMLNRDINGGSLIKIIPACFDRSIDRMRSTDRIDADKRQVKYVRCRSKHFARDEDIRRAQR